MAQIRQLVEPVLTDLGYELVELQLRNERVGLVLRFIIHREGGVTLDDCSTVSKTVGPLLEVEDLIGNPYHLEVSSPGLDRPLVTARDFERNMGQKVTVAFRVGEETQTVIGHITGVDAIMVTITVNGSPERIALTSVVKARLVIEF